MVPLPENHQHFAEYLPSQGIEFEDHVDEHDVHLPASQGKILGIEGQRTP